ncbi:MAG: hypothetical protein Q6366_011300 [Candidatus Freyarchaeota archaeon]
MKIKILKNDGTYSTEFSSLISEIVDKLMEKREVFKKLDKAKLIEFILSLVEKMPSDQRVSVTDDELSARIEKIMLIEAATGILNELSPEQTESFEAAAKRRELFQ